ncbi:hypothetical protein [Bdellovibrio sp. HCB2-146]|uniref:hypothetical protein n=1 Tax=Bdellovibrio sp. HCB2-146 TaxID=3394362 RepID=UPI0039BC2651
MKYIGCVLVLLCGSLAMAAIPAKKAAPKVNRILSGEGSTFGGLAGAGFTLLDVRRTADTKKKLERLVIDVGDQNGAPQKGWPGYYFAELKKNPQRLVLDFAQMPKSKLNEHQIAARMKNSLAVRGTSLSMDPIDNSLLLSFDLKPKSKVRVYQVAGKKSTSKVVIDIVAE